MMRYELTDYEWAIRKRIKEEEDMSAALSRRSLTIAAMYGLALSMPIGTAKAQGMKPIQNPITGNEDLGDLSQPEQALAQFYRAFNTRDLKMMDENFAHSDEVAIDNPLGGIRRGADEPHKMYEGVFRSPADGSHRILIVTKELRVFD